MVYGRSVKGRELTFEASGALMNATLVMRDRETDSWWSIMTSDAIGGTLEGADLEELPYGEKTTWHDWKTRHPATTVLSVGGEEHVLTNPYDNYFDSEETFRGLDVDDRRLPAKEHVFSFWLDGDPYAVTHRAIEGGMLYEVDARVLVFHRLPGEPFYSSSGAWMIDAPSVGSASAAELAERLRSGEMEGERLSGFDTFWYSWVGVNHGTELLN